MGPFSAYLDRAEFKGKVLPGVVVAKGCEFLLVSLGEGLGSGSGRRRGGSPVDTEGKGGGWGLGWGQAKEPTSQCARVCQNYPLANYPLVSAYLLPQTVLRIEGKV